MGRRVPHEQRNLEHQLGPTGAHSFINFHGGAMEGPEHRGPAVCAFGSTGQSRASAAHPQGTDRPTEEAHAHL